MADGGFLVSISGGESSATRPIERETVDRGLRRGKLSVPRPTPISLRKVWLSKRKFLYRVNPFLEASPSSLPLRRLRPPGSHRRSSSIAGHDNAHALSTDHTGWGGSKTSKRPENYLSWLLASSGDLQLTSRIAPPPGRSPVSTVLRSVCFGCSEFVRFSFAGSDPQRHCLGHPAWSTSSS
ncbi:hypothetical protein EUGRSUZ_G00844 [Eucalyptus grandis]|uniref:Uncharacterized protein n=2 Tax=Eucalyptus grandis TaxID=71139 RepID=A0ACC3K0P6_EUCGR|nr:hypothetical protein EUGRSUZ_G00844 [Eucalyptus grandis]